MNVTADEAAAVLTSSQAGLGILATYQFLTDWVLERGELVQFFPS